jgi:hypothetical protein
MSPVAGYIASVWHQMLSSWESVLILFAAAVLVPAAHAQLRLPFRLWQACCITAFCLGIVLDSIYLALPYLMWAAWVWTTETTSILFLQNINLSRALRIFALGYWVTGALWAVFSLAGYAPFQFDPVIVRLTAAHFHVAGFALTVIIAALWQHEPSPLHRVLAISALAGMPLVALGITLRQMGVTHLVEWFSAWLFAAMAIGVAGSQVRLALKKHIPRFTRRMWLAGAFSLMIGGLLAVLYAFRFVYPMEWINIPNMKIWHGTINAVGFSWFTLLGWNRYRH